MVNRRSTVGILGTNKAMYVQYSTPQNRRNNPFGPHESKNRSSDALVLIATDNNIKNG
jgi:hypothetical protein